MSERRSGRSRKQVDYTKFETDNDDDFADPTPPPAKKQKKVEKTEKKRDKGKMSKALSPAKTAGRQNRLPLDDKLYERDLQVALELSMCESLSEQDAANESGTGNRDAVFHSTPTPALETVLNKTELQAESQSVMPSAIAPVHSVVVKDDIEFLGSVTCSDPESPSSKRRTTTRKRKIYVDDQDDGASDDEDFSEGEQASDSDSDFDDVDSDFNDSKTKGRSKAKGKVKAAPANKKSAAVRGRKGRSAHTAQNKGSPVQLTGPAMTQTPVVAQAPVVGSKPVASLITPQSALPKASTSTTPSLAGSRASSASHKSPAWTPPGRSEGSSNSSMSLKSPSSGLRLGLSRHARIKPLHPSLKVS